MEGYYGKNCSHVCPPNCKTCRNTDGLCTCMEGWMGYDCSHGRCSIGSEYGLKHLLLIKRILSISSVKKKIIKPCQTRSIGWGRGLILHQTYFLKLTDKELIFYLLEN